MTKLLVVLLVVVVALWALAKRARGGRGGPTGRAGAGVAPPPPEPTRAAEDMVRCAHCGLHLPAPDAVQAGGRAYCSAEHAAAGSRPA